MKHSPARFRDLRMIGCGAAAVAGLLTLGLFLRAPMTVYLPISLVAGTLGLALCAVALPEWRGDAHTKRNAVIAMCAEATIIAIGALLVRVFI